MCGGVVPQLQWGAVRHTTVKVRPKEELYQLRRHEVIKHRRTWRILHSTLLLERGLQMILFAFGGPTLRLCSRARFCIRGVHPTLRVMSQGYVQLLIPTWTVKQIYFVSDFGDNKTGAIALFCVPDFMSIFSSSL